MTVTETEILAAVGQPRTVNAFTDPGASCPCVSDHNPNVITFNIHHIQPLAHGGADTEDNEILICATTHYSVHHLLREAFKRDVSPNEVPWEIRKRFGPFARDLAQQGWDRIHS